MSTLYSNLKFLQFPKQLEALRDKTVVAPAHVRIKPINACNHDCWYCAYHVDWLQLGNLMEYKDVIPKDKMFEIIKDIIDMEVKAVTFSGGGEPLLYPHIVEVVETLARGGVKMATLTNGSNLKGKVAEAFAEHGTWVRISIDGWDGPSYAKARNIKETAFDEVVQNMRDFAKRETKCVLGISYIVEKTNYKHIFEFAKLMKDVGVNHIKLSGCVVSNSGVENNIYHAKLKDVVGSEINKCADLNGEGFSVIDHYHELTDRFDKSYNFCPYLQYQTIIGADCKVYSCHDKAYTDEGELGSIKDRSFKEFWFSEENRQRIFQLNPSVSCQHHCVAHENNKAILDMLDLDVDHGVFV